MDFIFILFFGLRELVLHLSRIVLDFGRAVRGDGQRGLGHPSHRKPQGRRSGRDVKETEHKRLPFFFFSPF